MVKVLRGGNRRNGQMVARPRGGWYRGQACTADPFAPPGVDMSRIAVDGRSHCGHRIVGKSPSPKVPGPTGVSDS